jgi:hypothetical protein
MCIVWRISKEMYAVLLGVSRYTCREITSDVRHTIPATNGMNSKLCAVDSFGKTSTKFGAVETLIVS